MAPVADPTLSREGSLKIVSRTVQWRFDVVTHFSSSKRFKLGNWTWNLTLNLNPTPRLYASAWNDLDRNQNLHAKYILRVVCDNMTLPAWDGKAERQCFRSQGGSIDYTLGPNVIGKSLLIEFEFLNMDTSRLNDKQLVPEWPSVGLLRDKDATHDPLNCLSRMFTEGICTDVCINTTNGAISAHTAVLAASSPVFARMFENDFKEKNTSMVDVGDMSLESCEAFLCYLYGNLKEEELWSHRVALLKAAHKYGITKLQMMCEERLQEDIRINNVLERLDLSHLYELKNLKQCCLTYLFDFQKVTAIRETFISFLLETDQKLAKELLEIMLPK